MPVTVGDPAAILSGGIGRLAEGVPASHEEILTRGHWTGQVSLVFPPEGIDGFGMVELLYPIEPQMNANRMVYRTDALTWKVVRKSESNWRHEIVTLNYRVHRDAFPLFYNALIENKGKVITLVTPGVQPFIRPDEENPAYVLNIGKPVREKEFFWRMGVTFLRNPNACFPINDALDASRNVSSWESEGRIQDAGDAGVSGRPDTALLVQKDAGFAPRILDCQ
jgi:hypothetical protein